MNTIDRRADLGELIEPYPAPDVKPGTRMRFRFINGEERTLVALKYGRFRPTLATLARRWIVSHAYGAWLYARALWVLSVPRAH